MIAFKRSSTVSSDCVPIRWRNYFETRREVRVKSNTFRVYSSGNLGPVLLLIHGAGYSALTWSLFAKDISSKIDCRLLAFDLRGHGSTKTVDDDNLSLQILVQDLSELVEALFGETIPPIVLIGHSLGGSVATAAAFVVPNVVGACVIDVVEGTALKSLTNMQGVLNDRPSSFKSVQEAIWWSFKFGHSRNLEAARVSIPGQIKSAVTNEPASEEDDGNEASVIGEYTWRVDLSKTESYWKGWFEGLSQKFLDLPVPKILLLASIYGLDTKLTIGKMQGKFQLQVLSKSGHAIHEDQSQKVADVVASFLIKQRIAVSINGFRPNTYVC